MDIINYKYQLGDKVWIKIRDDELNSKELITYHEKNGIIAAFDSDSFNGPMYSVEFAFTTDISEQPLFYEDECISSSLIVDIDIDILDLL